MEEIINIQLLLTIELSSVWRRSGGCSMASAFLPPYKKHEYNEL